MEAQWGLPIKLIFILCIDRIRFIERALGDSSGNELAGLSYSFLEREPKTVDVQINLPPVPLEKKQNYINKREREWLVKKYGIKTDTLINPVTKKKDSLEIYWPMGSLDRRAIVQNGGLLDDKKAHDWMMYQLLAQSPRTISKVLEQTDYFLSCFTRSQGQRNANQIRLSDLILFNYLKFKYPAAVKFLLNVHPLVFPEFHQFAGLRMERFFRQLGNKNKTEKTSFEKFFRSNIDKSVSDGINPSEIDEIQDLLAHICYPLIDFVRTIDEERSDLRHEYEDKPNYDYTLSQPENLWDALTLATDTTYVNTDYLVTQRAAEDMKRDKKLPANIYDNYKRLLLLAGGLRRYYPSDHLLSEYIADRLAQMLINKTSIPRHPGALKSETPYSRATNMFATHLANYTAEDSASDETIDEAFYTLKRVLEAPTVALESKIHLLNFFFVYAQSNESENVFNFDRAREKFEKRHSLEVRKLISDIVEHGIDEYLPEHEKSIYDYEENYFYTMYQLWSGDPEDRGGIEKIRKVANYQLDQHPKIVESYWQNLFQNRRGLAQNPGLYIEMKNLLDVTSRIGLTEKVQSYVDYWTKEVGKEASSLVPATAKPEESTLVFQLRRLGYLDPVLKDI